MLTIDKVENALRKAITVKGAADVLKVNYNTLRGFMSRHGIRAPRAAKTEKGRLSCSECGKTTRGSSTELCLLCQAQAEGHVERKKLPYLHNLKPGTYIVTSMAVRSHVFREAFDACKNFTQRHNARLLILGGRAHVKALQAQPNVFHRDVVPYLCKGARLNKNLEVIDLEVNPQQINPLTGLNRYGIHSNPAQSVIVAHPYIKMQTVASPFGPRIIASTGSINHPDYLIDRKMGTLAQDRHTYRGWVIEVYDDEKFFPVAIEFDPVEGFFTHMGVTYHADGRATQEKTKILVYGDSHADLIPDDQPHKYTEYNVDALQRFQPEKVVFHDLLTGEESSHHNRDISSIHFDTYQRSLERVQRHVSLLSNHGKCEVYIIRSNHDLHLSNFFDKGDFRKLGKAYPLVLKHCADYLDCGNIYNFILKDTGISFKYVVIGKTELWYKGISYNMHGHQGPGGVKGSIANISLVTPKSVKGHTHTAGIDGHTDQVAYSGGEQRYCAGQYSSTMWCVSVTYENGQKQLVFRP